MTTVKARTLNAYFNESFQFNLPFEQSQVKNAHTFAFWVPGA